MAFIPAKFCFSSLRLHNAYAHENDGILVSSTFHFLQTQPILRTACMYLQ